MQSQTGDRIMTRQQPPLPEPIAQFQQQLNQWRSTNRPRTRLPEPFWNAAVELARQYGIYRTAHPLRLDYMRLKRRLNDVAGPQRQSTNMAFVELVSPATRLEECVIDFESPNGGKMRIQWKATTPPDWTSLLRAWREN